MIHVILGSQPNVPEIYFNSHATDIFLSFNVPNLGIFSGFIL